jgi:hypothetical protein
MLFSFGIVGDLITYFTNDYDLNWMPEDNSDGTNIVYEMPSDDYYPSPHFAIQVNLRESAPLWFSSLDKVVNAVDSIRPINTVFRGIDGLYTEDTYTIPITTNIEKSHYIYLSYDEVAHDYGASTAHEWLFDGNTQDNVGTYDGVNETSVVYTSGYSVSALRTGSFQVSAFNEVTSAASSSFSISFRVYIDNTNFTERYFIRPNSDPLGIIVYINNDATYTMDIAATGDNSDPTLWRASTDIVTVGVPLSDVVSQWYTIVITYGGSRPMDERLRVFVNGTSKTVTTVLEGSFTSIIPASYYTIGDTINGGRTFIDDMRVYNGILTSAQIASL